MRRVRAAAIVASMAIGMGLLAGAGSPAQAAAVPSDSVVKVASIPNPYRFGMYYYLWACQYFGDSLVQGGAFKSYTCLWEYYEPDNAYYWMLYVYS